MLAVNSKIIYMENKEKSYNLNLDSLVPFFLIGKEELDKRVWFKEKKEEYKEISKEFQSSSQDLTFDHLIVKFAETNQKIRHEGKWYKFTSFVKEILHISVVSGEIRFEEELKRIDEEYKDKLDNLRISPCEISLNWETTKLLMDNDKRKYYENREIKTNSWSN